MSTLSLHDLLVVTSILRTSEVSALLYTNCSTHGSDLQWDLLAQTMTPSDKGSYP
jgi:hypothetical protein